MVAILKQAEDDFCRKYVACSTEGAWIKLSKELANISELFFSYEEDAYIQDVLPMRVGYYTKNNIRRIKKMTREQRIAKNKKSLHKAALKVQRWRKRRLWWKSHKGQVIDKLKITAFVIATIVVSVAIGIWVLNSTPDTYTRGIYNSNNALVGHEHVVNGEVTETCYGPCHSNQ